MRPGPPWPARARWRTPSLLHCGRHGSISDEPPVDGNRPGLHVATSLLPNRCDHPSLLARSKGQAFRTILRAGRRMRLAKSESRRATSTPWSSSTGSSSRLLLHGRLRSVSQSPRACAASSSAAAKPSSRTARGASQNLLDVRMPMHRALLRLGASSVFPDDWFGPEQE